MADELLRAKYTGLDFDTLADDLRGRIQVQFAANFNDFALSSLGMVLLDYTAFGLDTLSFYLDRRATDTYIATARTRSAVSRLSRQLGYKMRGAVSAACEPEVSLKRSWPFPVTIPVGFQFQGPNGTIFETAQEVVFPANSATTLKKRVACYEGMSFQETFASDGSANQVFRLRRVPAGRSVAHGSVRVVVDGQAWTESDFLTFAPTNQFEVGYNDDPTTVRFGNGKAGNIPVTGASIVINYVAVLGKAGQVAKGTITKEVSPLVVAFNTIGLTVTNPEPSVGGDDPESIESAKSLAPKVHKSRAVAVTREDYEALAGSFADPLFGRVAVAQAINTRNAATDLELSNLLLTIDGAVRAPETPVETAISTATTSLEGTAADLATLDTTITEISELVGNAINTIDAASLTTRNLKNYANEVNTDAQDILDLIDGSYDLSAGQTVADDMRALVNSIPGGASDALTPATKSKLIEHMDRLHVEATAIQDSATTISNQANSAVVSLGAARLDMGEIGSNRDSTETPTPLVVTLDSVFDGITADAASVTAQLAIIQSEGDIAIDTVSETLSQVESHFSKVFAADCTANVVTVPILTRDASGFYAAPSVGLVNALQKYLDARKEVTQTVIVTNGSAFLLPAKITVRVGVLPGYVLETLEASVEAIVDGILRDRRFGQSLYQSDISEPIFTLNGVGFCNVTIHGHYVDGVVVTSKLDQSGNMIITDSEIITKGSALDAVTVTTELITPR